MKIQYLAIIFLIIIIPITLILTMYNQSQINNLNLQLVYNTYLSDATHNGIKAFELNTVNNKYSQVADSLKRDVEAAINVFLNSMAKSLGTSGATVESISEYVPAVLFTLYDGYYIYAPTYNEELEEITIQSEAIDGTPVNIITEQSQEKPVVNFNHMLKPYVYYTMRYKNGDQNDFIVNYSLDNYITIYGTVNGSYVTKSGYLLEMNSSNDSLANDIFVTIDQKRLYGVLARDILTYYLPASLLDNISLDEVINLYSENFSELKNYINNEQEGVYRTSLISIMGETLLDNMLNGKYNGSNLKIDLKDIPIAKIDEKIESISNQIKDGNEIIDEVIDCFEVIYNNSSGNVEITDVDAKAYYVKGLQFSMWVNNNLNLIEIQDARDSKDKVPESFQGRNEKIFNTRKDNNNNPEDLKTIFSQHKNEVIKNSIQSNLTSAIARYNQNFFGLQHGYDLKMPVLNDNEWEAITNKVTMVTFMQGYIIGNKVFNDYSVVSSDKNKEYVDTNEIYYFNKNSSGNAFYHRIDCPNLLSEAEKSDSEIIGYKAIEYDIYKSKNEDDEFVYEFGEKINDLRKEQLETGTNTFKPNSIVGLSACYDCIVNPNYKSEAVTKKELIFARYTAIGSERNRHYKVNSYLDSQY